MFNLCENRLYFDEILFIVDIESSKFTLEFMCLCLNLIDRGNRIFEFCFFFFDENEFFFIGLEFLF